MIRDIPKYWDLVSAHFELDGDIRSILVVPVKLGDEVIALIEACNERPYAFTEMDAMLVETVGGHVAYVLNRLVSSKLDELFDLKLYDFM